MQTPDLDGAGRWTRDAMRGGESLRSPSRPSRRQVIRAGLATGGLAVTSTAATPETIRAPALRLAHLTDMHVQPERRGGEGYAAALQSLSKLDPPPDLIVTGGDHVMDVFGTDLTRANVQWDLYERVLRENTKLPVYPIIGNHDVWGWGLPDQVPPATVDYGKAMALDRLQLRQRFYSFDAGSWHFICLDNIERRGSNYFGGLDEEQTEWLHGDLKATGPEKPICVFSHIPLLCACAFFHGGTERVRDDHWHVPDAWMHRDVKHLLNRLKPYKVRLLMSGHMHLVDRVDYIGMTFLCDGAVSGAWWQGAHQEFAEGYGVVDLWPDGTFAHQYVSYGWRAGPRE